MFTVNIEDPQLGRTADISDLQKAVSSRSVTDGDIFSLSLEGLRTALREMFGISDDTVFDTHPEFISADTSNDTVITRFFRRALVTALVEKNVDISR